MLAFWVMLGQCWGYEPVHLLWQDSTPSTGRQGPSYLDSALSSNFSNPIVLTSPLILANSISGGSTNTDSQIINPADYADADLTTSMF